ncbi:MAG: glycosyl transferase family 28 [Bacteroidota bacterium]|nr:glycosyl transferase family 28 [Bacteroidota bacterium]
MDHLATPPKVLVAPLDWGLGHATRCVPVIRQLLKEGCTVLLAGNHKVKAVLQPEFPQLEFFYLHGYEIEYASTSWGLPFKIVAQIPTIFSAIKKEERWLKDLMQKEGIDAVISDNRYGLQSSKIPSVFITHQLRIRTPLTFADNLLQKINYHYINRFTACWIPDAAGINNLSGELGHPQKGPKTPLRYIGLLTRFSGRQNIAQKHLLIILSGPEPQRTMFEKRLIEDLKAYTKPVIFIRGLPGATATIKMAANISVYNHLPASELEERIGEASFIISRCGYSTVMDMAAMQKKAILIPTPGQTEQQYLAKHLMKKKFALCVEQKRFRLKAALELAQSFPYAFETKGQNKLQEAAQWLIKEIASRRNLVLNYPHEEENVKIVDRSQK